MIEVAGLALFACVIGLGVWSYAHARLRRRNR